MRQRDETRAGGPPAHWKARAVLGAAVGCAAVLFASELLSQSEGEGGLIEFFAGTPVSAESVNANFAYLEREVEALRERLRCGTDDDVMVRVGPLCVDKYEASVWENPDGTGKQYGWRSEVLGSLSPDDYPLPCSDNGNGCDAIYAVSKPGVIPARHVTWFQAQQACANSGKRLLTNAEWQMAAAGTPDTTVPQEEDLANEAEAKSAAVLEPGKYGDDGSTTCSTITSLGAAPNDTERLPVPTGSRSACVSNWGVNDMVGNVWEWVGDWIQGDGSVGTGISNQLFGHDYMASVVPAASQGSGQSMPAAIYRGSNGRDWFRAGVFAFAAGRAPAFSKDDIGFRCAKQISF